MFIVHDHYKHIFIFYFFFFYKQDQLLVDIVRTVLLLLLPRFSPADPYVFVSFDVIFPLMKSFYLIKGHVE